MEKLLFMHLYPAVMKDMEIIENPIAIKVAMESTRNAILQLLKFREMSISELSLLLKKDKSNIHRHIKKLEYYGLVEMVKKERKGKNYEAYYGRAAKIFIISTDSFFKDSYLKSMKERKESKLFDILLEMGFRIKDRNLFENYFYMINKFAFEKLLEYNKDLDFNTLREIYALLSIIYVKNELPEFFKLFELS
ncbi:MAG: ArsR family transcriptional regulator [Euryarchaeota archaeon]|jgi:DNA-binding transcriptional ArsR family regulator|nr:ArsR family transcriptional regulator [Euryarchaeota archaeon]MVT35399.1 ArsR family transcriptional regulator [Euryarchaeota archaeon]